MLRTQDLTIAHCGDKGYISQKLFNELFDRGLQLVTTLRSNMKPKAAANMGQIDAPQAIDHRDDQRSAKEHRPDRTHSSPQPSQIHGQSHIGTGRLHPPAQQT